MITQMANIWIDAKVSIREMQIKIALRYYYPPTSMVKIKKIDNTKCLRRYGATEILYIADICVNWHKYFGKYFDSVFPQINVNLLILYDPAISLLDS